MTYCTIWQAELDDMEAGENLVRRTGPGRWVLGMGCNLAACSMACTCWCILFSVLTLVGCMSCTAGAVAVGEGVVVVAAVVQAQQVGCRLGLQ
jgi:hypothetical protein